MKNTRTTMFLSMERYWWRIYPFNTLAAHFSSRR